MKIAASVSSIVLGCMVLSACVSLGDLETQTPQQQLELKGNYYAIAECTKARQATGVPPGSRIDLLHDSARKEATVTWSTDLGAYQVYAFKGAGEGPTVLKIYSTVALPEQRVQIAVQCAQS